MICFSVRLLRFLVWSFLKAKLLFALHQLNGATSLCDPIGGWTSHPKNTRSPKSLGWQSRSTKKSPVGKSGAP